MRRREQLSPQTEAVAVEAAARGLGACGYDPVVRVKFQEEAGLAAEVLNPTSMLSILRNPDAEVVQACATVFNDWEAEFVSHDPTRLIGVSVIPPYDVAWAVNALERTLRRAPGDANQVLWGSDFPHTRSLGLEVQSALAQQLATLPRQDQDRVVGGNAAQLFNRNE
jgi:predicted TIM-barrel fold metal-dependent hydrolase